MVTTSMRQKGLFIKYILPNQPWNLNIIRLKSSRVTRYPKPILKQVGRGGLGRQENLAGCILKKEVEEESGSLDKKRE